MYVTNLRSVGERFFGLAGVSPDERCVQERRLEVHEVQTPGRPAARYLTLSRCRPTLALFVCSLLVCTLLAETLPRFSRTLRPLPRTYVGEYHDRPSKTFVPDPAIGWKMRPNVSRWAGTIEFDNVYLSNAQGFRSPYNFDTFQPLERIAIVGDSFAFGVGVNSAQTFSGVLSDKLKHAVVYNFAMPGFALDQMWLSARHYALPYRPSLLIVCFISESFTRSQEAYRQTEGWNKPTFRLASGVLVPQTATDRPGPLIRFLQHHSVTWRLSRLGSRAIAHYIPHGEWWHLNAAIIQQIRADATAQDVPTVFVWIPTYYWPQFPALRTHMTRQGANYIDLSAEPGLDWQTMYYPGDGHLNAVGHQYVAEVLHAWIRRNLPYLE